MMAEEGRDELFSGSKNGGRMREKSEVQQFFASYSDCEFLRGEAVADDDGTVRQSAAWLYENCFDDFLDEIAHALVEGGVGRRALMRVFLRHALRILNDDPDSLHAGRDDNRNACVLIDELVKQRNDDEWLREKVARIGERLPAPLGLGRNGEHA
jgi:hypothetical protein